MLPYFFCFASAGVNKADICAEIASSSIMGRCCLLAWSRLVFRLIEASLWFIHSYFRTKLVFPFPSAHFPLKTSLDILFIFLSCHEWTCCFFIDSNFLKFSLFFSLLVHGGLAKGECGCSAWQMSWSNSVKFSPISCLANLGCWRTYSKGFLINSRKWVFISFSFFSQI